MVKKAKRTPVRLKPYCDTCLCDDRTLCTLDKYTDVFCQVLGFDREIVDNSIKTCWECRAILHKILTFQNRVKLASDILKKALLNNTKPEPLSTLVTKIKANVFDATYVNANTQREVGPSHSPLPSVSKTAASENLNLKIELLDQNDIDIYNDECYLIQVESEENKNSILHENIVKSETETSNLQVTSVNDKKNVNKNSSPAIKSVKIEKLNELCEIQVKNEVNQSSDDDFCPTEYLNFAEGQKKKKKEKVEKYKIVYCKEDPKKIIVPLKEKDIWKSIERERESEYYKKKPFKCESCVIGFLFTKTLIKHNNECHKKSLGSHICRFCHSRFKTISKLNKHIKKHKRKYICNVCTYEVYNNIGHWRWHCEVKHKKAFECAECGASFNNKSQVLQHFSELHEKYICDCCGLERKTKRAIENHIRIHHTIYECNHCDLKFTQKKYLSYHVYKKHPQPGDEERRYCVECNRYYVSVHAYKHHLYDSFRHRRKKLSIPCPDENCDKVFTRQKYLNRHYEYYHSKTVIHQCEYCARNFSRPDNLRRHIQSKHANKPKKKFLCTVCGLDFLYLEKLRKHHITAHPDERAFKCPACPKRYTNMAVLARHRKKIHNDNNPYKYDYKITGSDEPLLRPYECSVCPKTYASVASLKKHRNKMHAGENSFIISNKPECMDKKCVNKTSKCMDETSECMDEASECMDEALRCMDETSECMDESLQCIDETSECMDDASQFMDEASECMDEASECMDEASDSYIKDEQDVLGEVVIGDED